MATMFSNPQQKIPVTSQANQGIPLNMTQERNRLNTEDQNNWTNNMNFLAMAGNMAGNLDWKTLLGMAVGFGLLNPMQKLFDKDKKSGTNEDSMNVDAIIGGFNPHAGEKPRTEYVLEGGDFFKPEVLNQRRGEFDFSSNGLLGNPETIYKKIKSQASPTPMSEYELWKYSGGNWR